MFWLTLKKLVSRVVFPLPFLLIALAAGLWMVWSPKRSEKVRRLGRLLLLAVLLLAVFIGVTGHWWLSLLAERYPGYDTGRLEEGAFYTIAVAGGGFDSRSGLLDEHRFGIGMRLRLLEAARLARACMERELPFRVAVSVSNHEAPAEEKERALKTWFAQFDVPGDRILLIEEAFNTPAEVARFAAVAEGRLLLVSEGYHLPRLMLLARRAGLEGEAAPAGVEEMEGAWTPLALIPSAANFEKFTRFTNEILGMVEAVVFH